MDVVTLAAQQLDETVTGALLIFDYEYGAV
jgi:hypothetical protein